MSDEFITIADRVVTDDRDVLGDIVAYMNNEPDLGYILGDGGRLTVRQFKDGVLFMEQGGKCVQCPKTSFTQKIIAQKIQDNFGDVQSVLIAVTGQKPRLVAGPMPGALALG